MALPHLTSPEAESILAQACENESNNAKRMRMGLEALSVCRPTRYSMFVVISVYFHDVQLDVQNVDLL